MEVLIQISLAKLLFFVQMRMENFGQNELIATQYSANNWETFDFD